MAERELQRRIAWNLKACRAALGLTQRQLGEITGRGEKYIGNIEQGTRNLRLTTVEALADELHLDPADLHRPVPVSAPPPRATWRKPDAARLVGRVPAPGPTRAGWSVTFNAEAAEAFDATLAALARQQVVVTITCRDGAVHDGVPVAALGGLVRCLRWDADGGVLTDEVFTLSADQVASVDVW